MVKAGKRLMILGAGPFQAPAIRKAAALGCHVITVNYLADKVGDLDGQRAQVRACMRFDGHDFG